MGKRKCNRSANRISERTSTKGKGELALSNQRQDADPVQKVFELDLLLEIIIHYAIRTNDGKKMCKTNLGNVRLVSKLWNTTASNVLRRNREPMFHLTLENDNWKGLVEKFMQTFDQRKTRCSFFLKLTALDVIFDPESKIKYTLKPFVRQFARCVVNLNLGIPLVATCKLTTHFQEWLPALHKLTIDTLNEYDDDEELPESPLLAHRRAQLSRWLQFQLDGNETLNELVLTNLNYEIPISLPPIDLLVSLRKLELAGLFGNNVLEILAQSLLPNLVDLNLNLVPYPAAFSAEVLIKMLINFRKTLRVLQLDVSNDTQYPHEVVNTVKFPVMLKLEELKTLWGSWQMDSDSVDFDHNLPNLKCLELFLQTEAMFAKWLSRLPAPKIETLGLEIISGNSQDFISEIRETDILRVFKTFPNLRSLKLKFSVKQRNFEGLLCLYKTMKQLISLTFILSDKEEFSQAWECVLTAIPDLDTLQIIKDRRHGPTLMLDSEPLPCIKDLTCLEKLSLENDAVGQKSSVVSDFVFDYVLLKMPNLKELCFGANVKVTEQSVLAWRNTGRKIIYIK